MGWGSRTEFSQFHRALKTRQTDKTRNSSEHRGVWVDPVGQRAISHLEASTGPAGTRNVKYQGFAEQNTGAGKQRTLQRFWISCAAEMRNLEAKIRLKFQARLMLKKFARFWGSVRCNGFKEIHRSPVFFFFNCVLFGSGKQRLTVILVKYYKVTPHKPSVITQLPMGNNTEQIFTQ